MFYKLNYIILSHALGTINLTLANAMKNYNFIYLFCANHM